MPSGSGAGRFKTVTFTASGAFVVFIELVQE